MTSWRWSRWVMGACLVLPAACASGKDEAAGPMEPSPRACDDSALDAASGTTRCGTDQRDAYRHRSAIGTGCKYDPPVATNSGGTGGDIDPGAGAAASCDPAACPGPYAYCAFEEPFGDPYCEKGCLTDADCAKGRICICPSTSNEPGTCVSADCETDADCAAGYLCTHGSTGCGPGEFHCETAQDECLVDADCDEFDYCGWVVDDDRKERRACTSAICN